MKKISLLIMTLAIVVVGIILFFPKNKNFLSDAEQATYAPNEGCSWIKKYFQQAGITAFIQNCPGGNAMQFTDSAGKIIGKWPSNLSYEFTIQTFVKNENQKPIDIVSAAYDKLTPDQQKICEIRNPETQIEYSSNGTLLSIEGPHPTHHKIRYSIEIKRSVVDSIFQKYGGDPGSAPERDYMCGSNFGSKWGSTSPYFEFDDRMPNKYIMVGSYGQEGPSIDLNSLMF